MCKRVSIHSFHHCYCVTWQDILFIPSHH
jgi:hypothetical protein